MRRFTTSFLTLLLAGAAAPPPVAALPGGAPQDGGAPESSAPPVEDGVEVIPAAAVADLAEAERLYRAGDCAGTLAALGRAEAAGARSGLLFYQQGYCHQTQGDGATKVELKRRAVPYFERQIEAESGGVDPYYYLAATYYQDLGDRAKGNELAAKAVASYEAGELKELGGESLFRLGRLCGFAMGAIDNPADEESRARLTKIDGYRVDAYRKAVEKMSAEETPNRVYLLLALNEIGSAARKAGEIDEAIGYYGRASRRAPLEKDPGYALFDIARQASQQGDLETALHAWRAIRGPDEVKTPAQYGIRLAERSLAYGDLPTAIGDDPIASLDRAALEDAAVEASRVLLRARAFEKAASGDETPAELVDEIPPTPEEVQEQTGVFLAAMIALLKRGADLRSFVLQHQLVPLLFR